MNTKELTQQMCDVIIASLNWIDSEPDSELIEQLKQYRQLLIELPNTVIEGQFVDYPDDPRYPRCC
jgi:hypothetical protein